MSNKFALPAIIAAVVLLTGTLGYMSPNFVEATEGSECEGKCMEKWSKKIEKCEAKEIKCGEKMQKCEMKAEMKALTCKDACDGDSVCVSACEDKAEKKLAKCAAKDLKCDNRVDRCFEKAGASCQ